jgi:hypothetical protein
MTDLRGKKGTDFVKTPADELEYPIYLTYHRGPNRWGYSDAAGIRVENCTSAVRCLYDGSTASFWLPFSWFDSTDAVVVPFSIVKRLVLFGKPNDDPELTSMYKAWVGGSSLTKRESGGIVDALAMNAAEFERHMREKQEQMWRKLMR